jgi:hypothetical protein
MCHHHRHRSRHEPAWTSWAAPPPPPPAGPIRAGDADRERVVEALRTHAGEGRLDAEELERRIERAYGATHLSELDAVLADLPRTRRPARPRPRARGGDRVLVLLAAVATLIVVTTLTGAYALWWLMWPVAMALHPQCSHRRRRAPARPGPVAS